MDDDPTRSWQHPWLRISLVLRELVHAVGGQALRLQLQALGVSDPKELDSVFAAMTRERAGALLVLQDLMLQVHRKRIVELAAKHRLPAMYERRE